MSAFQRPSDRARLALGRLKTGQMNRSEEDYGRHLEALKRQGKVLWYRFEGIKLRLADNTFYTPDFAVLAANGVLECHEVKGFWQDDGRAKIKIAAEMYPLRFLAVRVRTKKEGGGWSVEDFTGATDPLPVAVDGQPTLFEESAA